MSQANIRFKEMIAYLKSNRYIRNQQDFVERIGSDKTTVSQIVNDKLTIPNKIFGMIDEVFPFINVQWLSSGEGKMLKDADDTVVSIPMRRYTASTANLVKGHGADAPIEDGGKVHRVPLIPMGAFAGPISGYYQEGVFLEDCETIISPTPNVDLAIPITGDSMEPTFTDGSVIFVKKINDAAFIPWGQAMLIDTENGAFLKLVYPSDNEDCIEARSINPHYPPMQIPKTSIFGMYRVLNVSKFFTVM